MSFACPPARHRGATALLVGAAITLALARASAQRFSESPLPILVIDAAADSIPDEPKVLTRLRVVYNGEGVRNRLDGSTLDYVGAVAIERRGASSQLHPKRGFGLELRDGDGEDTDAPLLGMPPEEDWVLHGPYADQSLVRNAFTYAMARGLSTYAPRTRFVELVLDGEYEGVYLLTESVKRDRARVDVAKLTAADTIGEPLTGGYILKLDKAVADDPAYVSSFSLPHQSALAAQGTHIRYHYPKPDRIRPQQRAYIRDWMADFEATLAADDFEDPLAGFAPLIDAESFTDFLFVNEITRNIDAYVFSTYLYKERDRDGGRLHMGPVWDFNFALGYAHWNSGQDPEGWVFENRRPEPARAEVPFWWERLWSAREFREGAETRWRNLRADGGALSDRRLGGLLDSLEAAVGGEVAERNFRRWPTLGSDTHAGQVQGLRDFLAARLLWMDEQLGRDIRLPGAGGPAAEARVAPNPGGGSVLRVLGVAGDDHPVSVEWYDGMGRRVGTSTVERLGDVLEARVSGDVLFYRVYGAGGLKGAGLWLR